MSLARCFCQNDGGVDRLLSPALRFCRLDEGLQSGPIVGELDFPPRECGQERLDLPAGAVMRVQFEGPQHRVAAGLARRGAGEERPARPQAGVNVGVEAWQLRIVEKLAQPRAGDEVKRPGGRIGSRFQGVAFDPVAQGNGGMGQKVARRRQDRRIQIQSGIFDPRKRLRIVERGGIDEIAHVARQAARHGEQPERFRRAAGAMPPIGTMHGGGGFDRSLAHRAGRGKTEENPINGPTNDSAARRAIAVEVIRKPVAARAFDAFTTEITEPQNVI